MFTVVILFEKSGEHFTADGLWPSEASQLLGTLSPQVKEPWGYIEASDLITRADDDATGEATRVLTGKSGKRVTVTVTAEE